MNQYISHFFCLCLVCLLCSCAPFRPGEPQSGVCNELNSRIIFSGSTSDTRRADIQMAEEPLTQRTYDKHCLQ